ncbi:hypothetical protein CONCODRAFT_2214 [Conidiobolus coronatus NRRL 28638]|uniref:Uncharacterized protein n=1 Tax=Conidiobolus coronatus (strain ATCC 28846 / CBS 209.66 / NRRL 28638) TaxID=796925 RepID=A0A137PI28_CONC2|nr:hypothetical protein CONCODRAFT_2214 [Conidiobolus coronatus NRRL 28638]|eukprot:KXN74657.1 hypothetical protein CONCODRAFT_2214 [Conidiobolus coronatus NRRL 28638]
MLALEHLCSYITTTLVLLMILHTAFHAVLLEVKVNKCLVLLFVMLVFCLFNAVSNNILMNSSLVKYHLYGAVGACVFWIIWSQAYNMLVIQLNRFLIKPAIYRISKFFIALILIVQLVMTGVYVKANLGDKDPNGEDAIL